MRISEKVKQKVLDLDQRYRSSWDVRSIASIVRISPTSVSKILKDVRGDRPKPKKRSHERRTRFLLRDVMWSSDFMELPGKRWLLKTLDETSRFRLGWDVGFTQTKERAVAQAVDMVKRMGRVPLVWKYDHGSAFTSEMFQRFLEGHHIIPFPTPPRAPWANGRVERDHQEIQNWLIPLQDKFLSDQELENEIDEGMLMLNFIKPRMVLHYKTSADVYFHTDGVEDHDREWLALDLADLKCQLGPQGGERLHRRAVRQLLQKWGVYEEWEEIPKGAKIVNTSDPSDVAI